MNAKEVMFGLLNTTKNLLKEKPEDAERVAKGEIQVHGSNVMSL